MYEWKMKRCFGRGFLGHEVEQCRRQKKQNVQTEIGKRNAAPPQLAKPAEIASTSKENISHVVTQTANHNIPPAVTQVSLLVRNSECCNTW